MHILKNVHFTHIVVNNFNKKQETRNKNYYCKLIQLVTTLPFFLLNLFIPIHTYFFLLFKTVDLTLSRTGASKGINKSRAHNPYNHT